MAMGPILARLTVLAVLVLSLAAYFRFEIVTAGTAGGTVVYRLDRLTGAVAPCVSVTMFQMVCSSPEYSQVVK